jgi:hypothetical protein
MGKSFVSSTSPQRSSFFAKTSIKNKPLLSLCQCYLLNMGRRAPNICLKSKKQCRQNLPGGADLVNLE